MTPSTPRHRIARSAAIALFVGFLLTAVGGARNAPPAPAQSACDIATGRRLTVGPGQPYATPSAAAAVALVHSIRLTANLFAGTGSPYVFNGGVAAKVTQADNIVSSAANIAGAANIATPNFWPNASLAAQTVLATVPDANYLQDAPLPFVRRTIIAGAARRAGALQSAP